MNPDFTETQGLLQHSIRQYLEVEVGFARIRELEESASPIRSCGAAWWPRTGSASLLPEAVGGDAGLVEAGILILAGAPRAIVPAVGPRPRPSCSHGLRAMRASCSRRSSMEGRSSCHNARPTTPPSRHVAATVDAGGKLRGEKHYVDYADFATHHLVSAVGPEGLGLYLVERGDAAVTSEPLRCTGRTPQAIVRYAGAAARRVADAAAVATLVDLGRALVSAQILGCMEVALEQTVAYTNVRVQFGQPLATFQAVQHHAANMAMAVESARFMVYEALDALENGRGDSHDIAVLKAFVSRAVPEVTMLAHQLHGGQGLIEENDLYFFTVRGKDRALAWGSAEECLDRIAQEIESAPRWL
ncbi:MAG: acyl-CoA dehydrogenase family protein [Myxococcota bacterium]